MNNFGNLIYTDLLCFLMHRPSDFYFNERHLQASLYQFLISTNHYDSVELEYYIPRVELTRGLSNTQTIYPWQSDLRFDMVVSKNGEYAPIELKYKTKGIITSYSRFGNALTNIQVVKNQSAQDLGRYGFWKDVRRVELAKKRFSSTIKNGFCIFLTNDSSYQKVPTPQVNYAAFSMNEGSHGKNMSWIRLNSSTKKYPNFTLDNFYTINWTTIQKCFQNGSKFDFHFTILNV